MIMSYPPKTGALRLLIHCFSFNKLFLSRPTHEIV